MVSDQQEGSTQGPDKNSGEERKEGQVVPFTRPQRPATNPQQQPPEPPQAA